MWRGMGVSSSSTSKAFNSGRVKEAMVTQYIIHVWWPAFTSSAKYSRQKDVDQWLPRKCCHRSLTFLAIMCICTREAGCGKFQPIYLWFDGRWKKNLILYKPLSASRRGSCVSCRSLELCQHLVSSHVLLKEDFLTCCWESFNFNQVKKDMWKKSAFLKKSPITFIGLLNRAGTVYGFCLLMWLSSLKEREQPHNKQAHVKSWWLLASIMHKSLLQLGIWVWFLSIIHIIQQILSC